MGGLEGFWDNVDVEFLDLSGGQVSSDLATVCKITNKDNPQLWVKVFKEDEMWRHLVNQFNEGQPLDFAFITSQS